MYYYITINTASTILTLLRYVFFTELHVHTIIIRKFQFDENDKKKKMNQTITFYFSMLQKLLNF